MKKESDLPAVVERPVLQAELDRLRVREKAHIREGDAIAAARRRLPMVEIDASITVTGPSGPVTLLEAFEGRRQLIAYYFMWHAGHPAAEQCEGCTWVTAQVTELSYLHSRDITYAVFCQGPYAESTRYRDFMGWNVPWYSAQEWTGCPRLTGRPDAARRRWTTATRSWTSPSTDARRRGRTHLLAGRRDAPTRGRPTGRTAGRRCPRDRAGGPSPGGRPSRRGALTASAPKGRSRQSAS
jgi:hypothetical protein